MLHLQHHFEILEQTANITNWFELPSLQFC